MLEDVIFFHFPSSDVAPRTQQQEPNDLLVKRLTEIDL